ncbi:MAG TPA: aminotransferase class I/II-fold pyridoxal phosphate-dependent enzyme [Acidimicrobiales bacterium]|nr:aminotransferase class I/II-fold pyridoxal phosphate-dependent enzyme [Acidimicrobiales bacterium]
MREPFVPPIYPFDKLAPLQAKADALEGGCVDLSVGAPVDEPPPGVLEALASSGAERGYPASIGTAQLRDAASRWMKRRLGVDVPASQVAACIGTKELVAGMPHWLSLRDPSRDTVLYPAVAYPTYEMGALLAGLRAVPVPVDSSFRLDVSQISPDDARRAVVLWSNSPGNPAGNLDDLASIVAFGREHGVLVASDECYVELTWQGSRRTALAWGTDGVLAVHSISKRSNLAGVRAGFYAGDADVVRFLGEVRKHAGFMVPGPVQHAAAIALDDDAHVERQREIYWRRLQRFAAILREAYGVDAPMPGGGIYLWVPAPGGDAWGFAERLAAEGGALVSPGDFYGPQAATYVRVALVQPDDRLELVAQRLGVS